MSKLGDNYSEPWIYLGDFDMILDQSKKMRGLPYVSSSTDP